MALLLFPTMNVSSAPNVLASAVAKPCKQSHVSKNVEFWDAESRLLYHFNLVTTPKSEKVHANLLKNESRTSSMPKNRKEETL